MKNQIHIPPRNLLYLFLILAWGCNTSNDHAGEITHQNRDKDSLQRTSSDSNLVHNNPDIIWSIQYDTNNGNIKPIQLRSVRSDSLTPQMVIEIMNRTWPDVQTKFVKTSHDTLFVSIPNSTILTQQMGTEGALEFMITSTFTYTEVKGIEKVSFDFEEGDHAVPGVYTRSSWNVLQ